MLTDELQTLARRAEDAIQNTKSVKELDDLSIELLGRKGALTTALRGLASVSAEERPKIGALANEIKQKLETRIAVQRSQLAELGMAERLQQEREDVTEPGTLPVHGHLHLMTQAMNEITDIFARAGFTRMRFPEVEWDWYAFEALNMPKDHPARDDWETFFMEAPEHEQSGKMILTPHTTSGTARLLEAQELPIRVINIAKTYRRQIDMTHTPMFHQFDGVYVDRGVTVANLLGILDYFVKEFFGHDRKTRIRPYHFRFTEPSFEVDISCGVCAGTGFIGKDKCRTCKRGWLELGGAGMVHPNVLKAAKLDPKVYSAALFGFGVERTYMMKEGLTLGDIRLLYKNDVRFLEQF